MAKAAASQALFYLSGERVLVPLPAGEAAIPRANFAGVVRPPPAPEVADLGAAATAALAAPRGGPRLADLARACRGEVVIAVTDLTRPSPDDRLLPPLLEELARAGVDDARIRLVVGCGLHRGLEPAEVERKLGAELARRFAVESHDALASDLVDLGRTSLGCPVILNRRVAEAGLIVALGIVEPHHWAGYSGGRKTIAIGCAGDATIRFQHTPAMFDHPGVGLGLVAGNPFHENAQEIAERARLAFILNALLNPGGGIAGVVAGEPRAAFAAAVALAGPLYRAPVREPADIVVAGVDPAKASNAYQASRAASYLAFAPRPPVRQGGRIIIAVAPCPEGAGQGPGERRFLELMSRHASPAGVIAEARAGGYPAGAQRAYILARTLERCSVALAGVVPAALAEARRTQMLAYAGVDEALAAAFRDLGAGARVLVFPDALKSLAVAG